MSTTRNYYNMDVNDLQIRRAYRKYFKKTSYPLKIGEAKAKLVEVMGHSSARNYIQSIPGTSETREPL